MTDTDRSRRVSEKLFQLIQAEREGAWTRLPKEGTVRNIGILDIFESKKTKTGFAEGFTVWNERKNKVKCDFKVFNLSNWEDKPGG